MITIYYSDSKEKDMVKSWEKYANTLGFQTNTCSISDCQIVPTWNTYLDFVSIADINPKNTLCSEEIQGTSFLYLHNSRKVKQIIKFKAIR